MSLLLPLSVSEQENVLPAMLKFLNHPNEKIRNGFHDKMQYLHHYGVGNYDVLLGYFSGNEFSLLWYAKTHDHPQAIGKRPKMVGGLVLHADDTWGVHT